MAEIWPWPFWTWQRIPRWKKLLSAWLSSDILLGAPTLLRLLRKRPTRQSALPPCRFASCRVAPSPFNRRTLSVGGGKKVELPGAGGASGYAIPR